MQSYPNNFFSHPETIPEKTLEEKKFVQKKEQFVVSIRKQIRDTEIRKRRMRNLDNEPRQIFGYKTGDLDQQINIQMELQKQVFALKSHNLAEVQRAMANIKNILLDNQAYISQVLQLGALPMILNYSIQSQAHAVRKQACWLLACLTCGDHIHIKTLVENSVLDVFSMLLDVKSLPIVEQAVWGIANIAGDCEEYRQMILRSDIMGKLGSAMQVNNIRIVQTLCWVFSNLVKGIHSPNYQYFKPVFTNLANMLRIKEINDQALQDLVRCLATLTLNSQSAREDLVKCHILPQVYQRLSSMYSTEKTIIVLLIRLIGNIISSHKPALADYAINCGFLDLAVRYLSKISEKEICKQIGWVLSNIAAGTQSQAKLMFSNKLLMAQMLHLMENSALQIRREVAWAFKNLASVLIPELVYNFYESNNIVALFVSFLDDDQDAKTVEVGISGLNSIFEMSGHFSINGVNPLLSKNVKLFQRKMIKLVHSKNEQISELASQFLHTHRLVDQEEFDLSDNDR